MKSAWFVRHAPLLAAAFILAGCAMVDLGQSVENAFGSVLHSFPH